MCPCALPLSTSNMAREDTVSATDPQRSEYGEALRGRDEARRRLIGLQKEMLAAKAQRARVSHQEQQRAVVREARRQHDQITGRDWVAALSKAKPATEDDLQELAERLHGRLRADFEESDSRLRSGELELTADMYNKGFLHLFAEMDTDDSGRIDYNEFAAMLADKLRMKPPRQPRSQDERSLERWKVAIQEHEQHVMGLWRALDDVEGVGQLRGYITRGIRAPHAPFEQRGCTHHWMRASPAVLLKCILTALLRAHSSIPAHF